MPDTYTLRFDRVELYEPVNDPLLEVELAHARRWVTPQLAAKLGIPLEFTVWGIDFVRFERNGLYTPDPDSRTAALIAGVIDAPCPFDSATELIDLVAMELWGRRIATRLAVGKAMSQFLIRDCRTTRQALNLLDSPRVWLRHPTTGAALIHERDALQVLGGLATVRYQSRNLWNRLRVIMQRSAGFPNALVFE
jgi:hypothetical protein